MTYTIRTDSVVYREDLYPRIKPDAATIQRYAENLDVLPPIEVNQHNILIDGFHRWTAHRKAEAPEVPAVITQTASEAEVYALAIQRNAAHGLQMSEEDKKLAAIRLYASGTGLDKEAIAAVLSASSRSVYDYLARTDHDLKASRKKKIAELWLRCDKPEDISEQVGLSETAVREEIDTFRTFGSVAKSVESIANFADEGFKPPIYNVWKFEKEKTNEVNHFGNSEQRIVDNLLYLYTEPFDIVVDPFGGGGATIDVCKRRLRRYWVSDRKPIIERENEIRKHDLNDGAPPLNKRWSEVTLTYLDPPYWRQAAGQYSQDASDLANMPIDQFTETLTRIVKDIALRQSRGVIALLIQPTQWSADNREFTDHVTDLVRAIGNKRLILENRISCPYQSQQYNAQQVEWAKANRKLLVLTRELIIWRLA